MTPDNPHDDLDPRDCNLETCNGPCRSPRFHFPWIAAQMAQNRARTDYQRPRKYAPWATPERAS